MDQLLSVSQSISQLLSSADISPLYLSHFISTAAGTTENTNQLPPGVRHVHTNLRELRPVPVTRIYHVDSSYYTWPLYQRALCMLAPSTSHLCKTVVLENKRSATDNPSRYICVLVQYTHAIDTSALADLMRSQMEKPPARKHFNYRLASPEKSLELTGFTNNAVSPIGMTQKLPIVLSQSIAQLKPPVLWLGAGHIDYKLAMPVDSFIKATGCMVADISNSTT
ncbi:hypothetical protein IW152_005441 [Coemansia sp. BCRC 34962]|nr:hypothetical protein IW152_005441 [Coemansia sp. BCRC 34962]